ncbi:hypothetical protein Pelo_15731 [Pelomyxa schiedti]|nr:hypothetical protein Pelo_15731 [Pelomyxa schiedti]
MATLGKSLLSRTTSDPALVSLAHEKEELQRKLTLAKEEYDTQQEALRSNLKSLCDTNTSLEEEILRLKKALQQQSPASPHERTTSTTTADLKTKLTQLRGSIQGPVPDGSHPLATDSTTETPLQPHTLLDQITALTETLSNSSETVCNDGYVMTLKEEITELKNKVNSLQSEMKAVEIAHCKSIEQMTQQLSISDDKIKVKNAALESLSRDSQQQISTLTAKNEELTKQLAAMNRDLEESNTTQATLTSKNVTRGLEIDKLREAVQNEHDLVVQYEKSLSHTQEQFDRERAGLLKVNDDTTAKNLALKQANDTLTSSTQQQRLHIVELEETTSLQANQISSFREISAKLQSEVEENKKVLLTFSDQLTAERETVKLKESEISHLKEDILQLQQHVSRAADKTQRLEEDLSNTQKQFKKLQDTCDSLRTQLTTSRKEVEAKEKTIEELKCSVDTKTKDCDIFRAAIHDFEARETALQQKILALSELGDMNGQMRQQVRSMAEKHVELESKIVELNNTIAEIKINNEVQSKNDKQLIKELKEELQKLRQLSQRGPISASAGLPTALVLPPSIVMPELPSNQSPIQSPVQSRSLPFHSSKELQAELEVLATRIGIMQEEKTEMEIKVKLKDLEIGNLKEQLATWKDDFIQTYVSTHKVGERSTAAMDLDKLHRAKKAGFMGMLFQGKLPPIGHAAQLSEEMVTKMQAVLEETILRNFQLQRDLVTLGNQVSTLMEENIELKQTTSSSASQPLLSIPEVTPNVALDHTQSTSQTDPGTDINSKSQEPSPTTNTNTNDNSTAPTSTESKEVSETIPIVPSQTDSVSTAAAPSITSNTTTPSTATEITPTVPITAKTEPVPLETETPTQSTDTQQNTQVTESPAPENTTEPVSVAPTNTTTSDNSS